MILEGLCTKKKPGDVIYIEHYDAILELIIERIDGNAVYLRLRGSKAFKFKYRGKPETVNDFAHKNNEEV